jgi:hypothetical protein
MSFNTEAAVYRYFVTDIVSNTLLAEIPFESVSYGRALKGAGSFSGNIPVIDKTASFNLYDSTMPGKTALYVTRNGICVWGGIIWSRNYNLVSRTLDVNASEWTSYLHRRRVWKTWSHNLGATLVVSGGIGSVTLDPGYAYEIAAGSSVKVKFRQIDDFPYDGFYTIRTSPAPTATTFSLTMAGVPNGTYTLITVVVNTDTYDWVKSLIDAMLLDFTNLEFANSEIEPGISTKIVISNKQISGGSATLTTAVPHGVSPGQVVLIRNVDQTFNGQYIVASTPNPTTLTYAKSGSVASTPVSVNTRTVTNKQLIDYLATLTTSGSHGFSVGQKVVISGVDPGNTFSEILNGEYIILSTTANTFSYLTAGVVNIAPSAVAAGATAVVTPYVLVGTYGPYTANSDIGGLDYSTDEYSGVDLEPETYRGFELRNVGEELDKYSDRLSPSKRKGTTVLELNRREGFEYRIDCFYDPDTASFKREFQLLPISFPDEPAPGEVSPISRFGADQLVFEYPGQISDFTLDEKSDDAVTRMWVVGNIGDLGEGASQPYAAAASLELLLDGWPILEDDHSENDFADEDALEDVAYRYLSEFRPPLADITVGVNGSLQPVVGTYAPGDWCSLVIDDEFVRMRLASDLEPRDTVIVRKIDSYTVSVPNSPTFPEKVTLKLIAEWEVDKRG